MWMRFGATSEGPSDMFACLCTRRVGTVARHVIAVANALRNAVRIELLRGVLTFQAQAPVDFLFENLVGY